MRNRILEFPKELLKVERIPCLLELRLETQTTVEVWSTIIGDLTGGLLDHCWMDYWFPELTNKNLKKSRFEVWLTIGGFCQQKIFESHYSASKYSALFGPTMEYL